MNFLMRRGKTIRNRLGYKLIYRASDFDGVPANTWEFYYLGGDPLVPLAPGLLDDEDPREEANLVDPTSGELQETLDGDQKQHLEPILDDLRARLGAPLAGAGPTLAASNKCDVNGDERIDSADVLSAMRISVEGSSDLGAIMRADVAPPNDAAGEDGDGIVDSADILLILRAVSGAEVKSCDHTLI
jgi:hypothetical protein